MVYSCLRRSLCYPLHRHWGFSLQVLQDLRHLFRLGKWVCPHEMGVAMCAWMCPTGRRKLLQCVLRVKDILNSSEPYYILNNLYMTDYAIWLQSARCSGWGQRVVGDMCFPMQCSADSGTSSRVG